MLQIRRSEERGKTAPRARPGSLIAALLICFAGSVGSLCAQTNEESRAAEIIAQRQAKTGRLAPEVNSGLEQQLLSLKENKILERITAGIGGVRLKLGGLATNGGFAIGPEYLRHNHGTRRDDPNDTIPHEHRRDLRGFRVFCAWLDHDDSRAINSLDMIVNEVGVSFIKHYLVDFGSTLGSASNGPNSPRSGFEELFSWTSSAKEFFTLGLWVPRWARARYPNLPSVGRFEYEAFDAERWTPEYPNPAFSNMLPDDGFWAARQVMAFTDEQIDALVKTGELSDTRAAEWVAKCLIERRNKIGRVFSKLGPPPDHLSPR